MFAIVKRAKFVCLEERSARARNFRLELCPQCDTPFSDVPADSLSYPREKLRHGNPEDFFARECGLKRRQPAPFFISRHLSTILRSQQKSYLLLRQAGSLAICPEIVF